MFLQGPQACACCRGVAALNVQAMKNGSERLLAEHHTSLIDHAFSMCMFLCVSMSMSKFNFYAWKQQADLDCRFGASFHLVLKSLQHHHRLLTPCGEAYSASMPWIKTKKFALVFKTAGTLLNDSAPVEKKGSSAHEPQTSVLQLPVKL